MEDTEMSQLLSNQLISLLQTGHAQLDANGTISIHGQVVQLSEGMGGEQLDSVGTPETTLEVGALPDIETKVPELVGGEVMTVDCQSDLGVPLLVSSTSEEASQVELSTTIQEDLQIDDSGSYFLQAPDGQLLQVLSQCENADTDEMCNGESEQTKVEKTGEITGADGVQILMLSSGSVPEEVYLIDTPSESNIVQDSSSSIDLGNVPQDAESLVNSSLSSAINPTSSSVDPKTTIHMSLVSPRDQEENSAKEESIRLSDCHDMNMLDIDVVANSQVVGEATNLETVKLPTTLTSTSKALGQKVIKSKPKPSVKFELKTESLEEGTRVQTDQGEMVAMNLSSVEWSKKGGSQTCLETIAKTFGSMVKVLKPVEVLDKPQPVVEGYEIHGCNDCGLQFHSTKSLESHCRKYHRPWEVECFICAEKFLNHHSMRTHVQTAHKDMKEFKCRFCEFECRNLAHIMRHRKVHEQKQVCGKCGRKYLTKSIFDRHVAQCKSRGRTKVKRTHTSEHIKSEDDCAEGGEMGFMEEGWSDLDEDDFEDVDFQNDISNKKKISGIDSVLADDTGKVKRKYRITNVGERNEDKDFTIVGAYQSQQLQKISQRKLRMERSRSHRCYLCFKLFKSGRELEDHKENYHKCKSARPVRVKTDASLDDYEEDEDPVDYNVSPGNGFVSSVIPNAEGDIGIVQVKKEPPNLNEDCEMVTIIFDDNNTKPQVVKPVCVTCNSHTSKDFKMTSHLFKNASSKEQIEIMKRFENFFPSTFDDELFSEPWFLCRKCVVTLDKINALEEELNTMKRDLLTRVGGKTGGEREDSDKNSVINSELCLRKRENVQDALSNIAAYMEGKCEIMEITRPKKRGRPKNVDKETLIPILLSDNDESTKAVSDIDSESVKNCHDKGGSDVSNDKNPELVNVKEESFEHSDLADIIQDVSSNDWHQLAGEEDLSCLVDVKMEDSLTQKFPNTESAFTHDMSEDQNRPNDLGNTTNSDQATLETTSIEVTENGDSLGDSLCQQTESDGGMMSKFLSETQENTKDIQPPSSSPDQMKSMLEESQSDKEKTNGLEKGLQTVEQNEKEEEEEVKFTSEKGKSSSPLVPSKGLQEKGKTQPGRKRTLIQKRREQMSYMVEDNSRKPWACTECHKGFSTQRGACDHYAAHHMGQAFTCRTCNVSYVRKRDLIGHHNKVHLKKKPYKCTHKDCTEAFSAQTALYRHVASVHRSESSDSPPWCCPLCSSVFLQKRYLQMHLKMCRVRDSDERPYKCLVCGKAFKVSRHLRVHVNSVHSSAGTEQFYCEVCNKVLTDKKNLVLHMRSHTGESSVTCEVCGKQFGRKAYLWTHARIHTNERPYGCNYCTKWFKQYSTWKTHERSHTGERPYVCCHCGLGFITNSSMKKHIEYAHLNVRNFPCGVCGRAFITRHKLEEHAKVHTGEKPHRCHICHKAFNKKGNLRAHLYVHSENKRFKCEICGEGFMRRAAVETHIVERHRSLDELDQFLRDHAQPPNDEANQDSVKVSDGRGQLVTAPGIPGTEEMPADDQHYIIIYAGDGENEVGQQDMQVTVYEESTTKSKSPQPKGEEESTEIVTSLMSEQTPADPQIGSQTSFQTNTTSSDITIQNPDPKFDSETADTSLKKEVLPSEGSLDGQVEIYQVDLDFIESSYETPV